MSDEEKKINALLIRVRDAGALDDNNGAEDWTLSDNAIAEARTALLKLVVEAELKYLKWAVRPDIYVDDVRLKILELGAELTTLRKENGSDE